MKMLLFVALAQLSVLSFANAGSKQMFGKCKSPVLCAHVYTLISSAHQVAEAAGTLSKTLKKPQDSACFNVGALYANVMTTEQQADTDKDLLTDSQKKVISEIHERYFNLPSACSVGSNPTPLEKAIKYGDRKELGRQGKKIRSLATDLYKDLGGEYNDGSED